MASNLQPIIVKKKRHGEHAFHGGHWKVALADFMTSMFIIFLLLWLLSQVPPIVREGIADYFNPQSPSRETSGNNGVLGGQTLASPGAQRSTSAPIGPIGGGPTSPQENEGNTETPGFPGSKQNARGFDGDVVGRGSGADGRNGQFDGMRGPGTGIGPGPGPSNFPSGKAGDDAIMQMQANGELALKLGQEISMAIQKSPELNGLQQNVLIEPTQEGVRIQLVDNDKRDMFPKGTAQPLPQTQQLMAQVAKIVAPLTEKLSITGHTDSLQFGKNATYTNWELSADRANAARRLLVANGISEDRLTNVMGKADKEHLFPDQPNAPQNRRISITLLAKPPGSVAAAPAPVAAPPPPAVAAAPVPTAPIPTAPGPRAVVSTTPTAGPAPDGRLLPIQR